MQSVQCSAPVIVVCDVLPPPSSLLTIKQSSTFLAVILALQCFVPTEEVLNSHSNKACFGN